MDNNAPYLKLITSEYSNKPKYNSYVEAFLNMVSPSVNALDEFNIIFNIENAIGDQLDKLGSLVGITRSLPISNPNIPSVLGDDSFRKVILSRAYSNHWDGTRKGLEEIFSLVFPNLPYEIVDGQDMSYSVSVIDPTFSDQDFALLQEGYILPKPSGVSVSYNVIEAPLFGWDTNTSFVKGWDEASWAEE